MRRLRQILGCAFAVASAFLLSACQSLSPDGGMSTVAMVAGGGLNQDVVRISSAEECQTHRQAHRDGSAHGLNHARAQVLATEARCPGSRRRVSRLMRRKSSSTRLMGLWGAELGNVLPSALPPLRGKSTSLAAVQQEAMDRRVDLAVGRLEVDALARSYGLTRSTRFINVLEASGISKTQKDTGEPAAQGGGYDIAFEVPIYDFGRAKRASGNAISKL